MDKAAHIFQQLKQEVEQHEAVRSAPYRTLEDGLSERVGQMLRRSRNDRGWSQRLAAEKLNISRAQYLRYESGDAVPRLHTAIRWSLLFGVPATTLLNQTAYATPEDAVPSQFFRLSDWLCNAPANLFLHTLDHVYSVLNCPEKALPAMQRVELLPTQHTLALEEVSNHDLYYMVGANLRFTRQMLNYSQEDMANGLGISTSHYLAIERGEVAYSFLMVPRFRYSLQIQPTTLTLNTQYYQVRLAMGERFNCVSRLLSALPEPSRKRIIEHIVGVMDIYQHHRP